MKKIIILAIFLGFVPLLAFADFSISQWKYYKDVDWRGSGLVKISLDDEIFSQTNKDLGDIRIISSDNKEIPFKLITGKEESLVEGYSVKMINNSYVPSQFSSVILDFEGRSEVINQIKIETESENFQRNVRILGSDNKENWNIIKEGGYIYDYTDKKAKFKSQNTSISFPESSFHYLKIEIADENNNPVKISSVSAIKFVEKKSKELVRIPEYEISNNYKEGLSEIVVDVESSGIPTNKINFSISDANFNRAVLIYSSEDKKNWKLINNGYIFRYNTDKFKKESLDVNFTEITSQYIKVVIRNNDNDPLGISGIKIFSRYRELIFQSEFDKKYQVFYGNSKTNYPEYDIEKYWQYLNGEQAKDALISNQKNNSQYISEKEPEKPISERIPFLFPVALSISSLILIFLVVLFFKKEERR